MVLIKIYNNTSQKYFKQQVENYVKNGYEEVHLYDKVKITPSLNYTNQVIHCTNPTEIYISDDQMIERVYLIRYTTDIPDKVIKEFNGYIVSQFRNEERYISDFNIVDSDFNEIEINNKIRNGYYETERLEDTNTSNYYFKCYSKILECLCNRSKEKMCEIIYNYPNINIIYMIYDIFRNLYIVSKGNLEQCYNPISRTGLTKSEIETYQEILKKNNWLYGSCRSNMDKLSNYLDYYKEGKLTETTLKNISTTMLLLGENYEKETNK